VPSSGHASGILLANLVLTKTADIVPICEESSANGATAAAEHTAGDSGGLLGLWCRRRLLGLWLLCGAVIDRPMLVPVAAVAAFVEAATVDGATVSKTVVQKLPAPRNRGKTYIVHSCTSMERVLKGFCPFGYSEKLSILT
jgi:hypothetical protein